MLLTKMEEKPIIQINLLPFNSSRIPFTEKSLDFLCKINQINKTKIKVSIFADKDIDSWTRISNKVNDNGIKTTVVHSRDYMSKVKQAILSDCEYSCCMDEDVMMSEHVWDYLIENVDCLKNDNFLLLSPLLSNGIPTVELFIESFFEDKNKEEIYNLFNNIHIPNMWGANYSTLNFSSDKWIPNEFYRRVKNINHHYKGIHPVRISYESHLKIAKNICDNKDKFLSKQKYRLVESDLPYFCNNIFFMKTSTWSKIVTDRSLFRDSFDEVPINIYKEINSKKMLFVDNAYALHMAYNTINEFVRNGQKTVEDYYYNNFLDKI